MRKCRFCAEEIQDAAIVCKHCGRELTAPTKPTGRASRWGRIGLAVALVLAAFLFVLSRGDDDPKLAAFKVQRAAWHHKCDQYMKTPLSNPAAAACNQELNSLVAYGKQNGW